MYVKLFSTITDSTVWSLPATVRVVWVTMLARCDRHGYLAGSPFMLSKMSNLSLPEVEHALALLGAPDPHSRSKEYDGRRITTGPDGWQILNYAKYRAIKSAEERRAYRAEWIRNKRADAKKSDVDSDVDTREHLSTPVNKSRHIAEAEAEAEAEGREPSLPIAAAPSPKPRKAKAKYPGLYEDHRFDEFWSNYPLRLGKKKAWEAWLKLAPPDREAAAEAAIEYGFVFSKATPDRKQFIPHPTTWLNSRGFEDDREAWRLKAGPPAAPPARRLPEVGKGEWNPDEAQKAAIRAMRGEDGAE